MDMFNDKRDELWNTFDKLSSQNKVDWLLEFECIFECVRGWDDELLKEETKRMKEML